MNEGCTGFTHSGAACAYPAALCPLHGALREVAAGDGSSPASTAPKRKVRELRAIGQAVADQVVEGTASPLQASRFIRSLNQLHALGQYASEDEEQQILAEVELRGRLMQGLTPRDDEQWQLARDVFNDESFEEFVRWARDQDPVPPYWVPNIPEAQLPRSLRGPQPQGPPK